METSKCNGNDGAIGIKKRGRSSRVGGNVNVHFTDHGKTKAGSHRN